MSDYAVINPDGSGRLLEDEKPLVEHLREIFPDGYTIEHLGDETSAYIAEQMGDLPMNIPVCLSLGMIVCGPIVPVRNTPGPDGETLPVVMGDPTLTRIAEVTVPLTVAHRHLRLRRAGIPADLFDVVGIMIIDLSDEPETDPEAVAGAEQS